MDLIILAVMASVCRWHGEKKDSEVWRVASFLLIVDAIVIMTQKI
jgi:hypothetical protein